MPSPYRSTFLGTLPASADAVVAGVRLPSGLLVFGDGDSTEADPPPRSRPLLWVSAAPCRDLARVLPRLYDAFASTGLWPLALESMEDYDSRPWLDGELDREITPTPDNYEPQHVLAEWWGLHTEFVGDAEAQEEAWETLAPFGPTFPGLAPASTNHAPDGAPAALAGCVEGRLGLVSARRPADVPSVLGWRGTLNWFEDTGPLCSVLRSWEDRFDAYVIAMGFDTITFAVGRPPATLQEALAVAAEHYAVCPDRVDQGSESLEALAHEIRGSSWWRFWWD